MVVGLELGQVLVVQEEDLVVVAVEEEEKAEVVALVPGQDMEGDSELVEE